MGTLMLHNFFHARTFLKVEVRVLVFSLVREFEPDSSPFEVPDEPSEFRTAQLEP